MEEWKGGREEYGFERVWRGRAWRISERGGLGRVLEGRGVRKGEGVGEGGSRARRVGEGFFLGVEGGSVGRGTGRVTGEVGVGVGP